MLVSPLTMDISETVRFILILKQLIVQENIGIMIWHLSLESYMI
jgi:hypothetical protein